MMSLIMLSLEQCYYCHC